jgi:hypothetical protein
MIYGILCIVLGLYIIYRGIRVIKTRLTYWVTPTFGRYKDRNTEKSGKFIATITGISNFLIGAVFIFFGFRIIMAN